MLLEQKKFRAALCMSIQNATMEGTAHLTTVHVAATLQQM